LNDAAFKARCILPDNKKPAKPYGLQVFVFFEAL